MKLNRTSTELDRNARNNENANWVEIENTLNDVVGKISDEAFEKVIDAAKLNWLEPVNSHSDLPSNASEGDTRMVRDTGKVYRYSRSNWREIQQIDAGPVNEVDRRLSANLAQIATNAVSLGVKGNYNVTSQTGSDDTTALQNIFDNMENGERILFPKTKGVIAFSDKITIRNKKDFKLYFFGATLYDLGKDILLSDGSYGTVPVGILFENCSDFEIYDLTHNGYVTSAKQVHPDYEAERVPQIDFADCKEYKVHRMISKGNVGPYISNLSLGAEYMMRASYFRFVNGVGYELNDCGIAEGSGGGEFFSIKGGRNIRVNRPFHFQGGSQTTFWSMGKAIDVEDFIIDGMKVQSKSTGSLWDISGKNIQSNNNDIDYPNGAMYDITNEWGFSGSETVGVKLLNNKTNGKGVKTEGDYHFNIKGVEIDDFKAKDGEGHLFQAFQDVLLKNQTFRNTESIISLYDGGRGYDFEKRIKLEEININNTQTFSGSTRIEGNGLVEYVNGLIDLNNNNNPLEFIDRYAADNNLSDLTGTRTQFVLRNVHIKNAKLMFRANVRFENCIFENCAFMYGNYDNVSVEINNDSEVIFTTTNPLYTDANLYFQNSNTKKVNLTFNRAKIKGEIINNNASNLMAFLVETGSTIEFISTSIDVKRNLSGALSVIALFTINERSNINLRVKDSYMNDVILLTLAGGQTGNNSPVNINVSSTDFYGTNAITLHSSNTSGTNTKVSLIISGSQIPSVRLAALQAKSAEFKKFVESGNAAI